jgi:3',5'-cyclic AMP phosphodiesterase CpdA
MQKTRSPALLLVLVAAVGCPPRVQVTPPPAATPAPLVALTGASVLIGAGDIAGCSSGGDERTAILVDSVLKADSAAKVNDAVFTLGDNAYMEGTAAQFRDCFSPTWGTPTRGIMKKIHPAPGNHEYLTKGANPYYEYFGDRAGTPSAGYYSYDIGAWHAVVLNSEIVVNPGFTDQERKAQEDWLRKDLKDKGKPCTLAYWHHPRFSSGWHGSDARFEPVWQILYDNGVDLVLNGHDHDYERFIAQTPTGQPDSVKGIPEIIAGTGGEDLRGFGGAAIRNSVYRIEGRYGVLLLTLGGGEYRSAWLEVGGRVWDPSGGKCH